ncbi:uncharacterized protein [Drosophila virilis]|uniref:Uncharacterized protein, isoform A n=1 Tax=Drosophila virilis TaxID=7244 RepID=B4M9X0_DROVI|nr:uncharacterized protein LOC6634808 isoform X1 [Drosophila virilis]EDW66029.1 uncharacterized protein Dvir_GJ15787, isoform A [Drosophila virilis]
MLGLRLMLRLLTILLLGEALAETATTTTTTTTTKKPVFELPERCKYLKDTKELMHLRCKGNFPLVAYTKFRDTFMKQTDRMALFMPNSMDYVMVALKESELHDCDSIRLIEVNEYICYPKDGGKRTVKLRSARMYCFPFHIQLPDDLMHECLVQKFQTSGSTLQASVLRTKRGIIHYTFDNDSAVQYLLPKQIAIFLTILILSMLLYF